MVLEDASALPASDPLAPLSEILIPGSSGGSTLADVSGHDPLRPEPAPPDQSSEGALTTDPAALRDAQAIADRIAEDEQQADDARQLYQVEGLPSLEADDRIKALRLPDETLHAVYGSALLESGPAKEGATQPQGGTLYLTSDRLIHAGERLTEVPLTAIEEVAIALERLLLIRVRDGLDLALEVSHPRLLRVQIAAAKAAARGKVG